MEQELKDLKKKYHDLRVAAIAVLERIEANDVDFSKYGGQEEVNTLAALLKVKVTK